MLDELLLLDELDELLLLDEDLDDELLLLDDFEEDLEELLEVRAILRWSIMKVFRPSPSLSFTILNLASPLLMCLGARCRVYS